MKIYSCVAALLTCLALAGCGCSWGTATTAEVSPKTECLTVGLKVIGCAQIALEGRNGCQEALRIQPRGGALVVEVAPGEPFDIDAPADYAKVWLDDETCMEHYVFDAQLGNQTLSIDTAVEAVNRGAGSC